MKRKVITTFVLYMFDILPFKISTLKDQKKIKYILTTCDAITHTAWDFVSLSDSIFFHQYNSSLFY